MSYANDGIVSVRDLKQEYQIADILFDIQYPANMIDLDEGSFLYVRNDNISGNLPVEVSFEFDSSIKGESNEAQKAAIIGTKTRTGYKVYSYDIRGNVAHVILASPDWKKISVRTAFGRKVPFTNGVGEFVFRTAVLFYRGIVIHAAAIDYQGQGVIFSAPSGTGKSTHAHLWENLIGADIINGDRPVLRVNDNHVDLYGTPWSGTSKEFINRRVPLKAIVMLEQGAENEIRLLSPAEAVQRIVPRCFLPFFDDYLMALALDSIDNIIERVPVYHLKCRPDKGALELVLQEISRIK